MSHHAGDLPTGGLLAGLVLLGVQPLGCPVGFLSILVVGQLFRCSIGQIGIIPSEDGQRQIVAPAILVQIDGEVEVLRRPHHDAVKRLRVQHLHNVLGQDGVFALHKSIDHAPQPVHQHLQLVDGGFGDGYRAALGQHHYQGGTFRIRQFADVAVVQDDVLHLLVGLVRF